MSPDRARPEQLRRGLGSPVLWGLVQAFIAASFYFSLGLVAERALGFTWIVYAAAAVFFVLTALSYVEGASLHQERGGATVIARYAFNELWSFVAGWAVLLDYVILIALTAFVATNYLGIFWGEFSHGAIELATVGAIIAAASWINFRGLDPRRFERFFLFALADLGVQVLLLIFGLMVLFDPHVVTHPAAIAGDVDLNDIVYSFTLAVVAFTALDASSGFAGQVQIGRRGLRRLLGVRTVSMLITYVGLALVASSTLGTPRGPRTTPETPLIGVVEAFEQESIREVLRYVVAASAVAVLFTACVGSMLGLSRLGYSLAVNRQIPSALGRLHPVHATPFVAIAIGAVLAFALAAPEDVKFLGAIYAFGATLAFTLVHLSVLVLRRREPDRDRPFRIPFGIRVAGAELPVPAIAGALVSAAAFAGVLSLHSSTRIVGPLWMAFGVTLYVVYRRSQGKPLYRRVTVPEKTLTRSDEPGGEYGSILVPVLGTPLDDDIMQTAGRLAAEEGVEDEEDEEGAQIEAMWVFEVPMSMALDGRQSEVELRHALDRLAHAKAVGEEYEGVTVNTFTVRARNAGQAIVHEARRRGVEAIVMPAEEPTRVRGGVLFGGKQGLRDTFVGETTRYVVNKAGCRVVLTAPPAEPRVADDAGVERPGAPPPPGDPMRPVRRATERLRRPARRPAPPDA